MTSHLAHRHAWPVLLVALANLFLIAFIAPGSALAASSRAFVLIDQNGNTVTDRDMLGHPYLIFFGFTHCPGCTTPPEVSAVLRELGPEADRVGALFVTVDPRRDTPMAMKQLLSGFDPHIRGLTGSVAAVDALMKAYHIYHHKVPFKGGYAINHTTTVFLVDKNGRLVGPFDVKRPPRQRVCAR